jgi:hypothetical protein
MNLSTTIPDTASIGSGTHAAKLGRAAPPAT